MKKLFIVLLLLLSTFSAVTPTTSYAVELANEQKESKLHIALAKGKNVTEVTRLESELFTEKFLVRINQPLDHKNPALGSFSQRFIVAHEDFDAPVVMVTEGYGAAYALNPNYRDELSKKLNSNQVVVEHRYFLESTPEPCDWQYMTGENSANDLHNINTLLKEVYKDKWITTGISKGGQTTMIYRTFFPNDVDISVPYVGPICFGVEDGRHEPFLLQCGTKDDQERILAFQKAVLTNKESLVKMLDKESVAKKWDFQDLTTAEVLDYCVLEYPFALWQWGTPTSTIPNVEKATDKELFDHLMRISSASYFGDLGAIASFFVQAATDLGYYGYDTKPLKELLTIKSADGYLRNIFLPKEAKDTEFNTTLHKQMYKFLKKNDPKMIFIYGEFDPWTAAAPEEFLFKGKENMVMYLEKGGSHTARIATMSESVQEEIWNKINSWLNE